MGSVDNKRVSAYRGGQDVKMYGDSANRHDNYRKVVFELNPCKPSATVTCNANPEVELAKMELVVMYNTEKFDKHSVSEFPITRESVIKNYEFNPKKRYELKTHVTRGLVEENRSLYVKN